MGWVLALPTPRHAAPQVSDHGGAGWGAQVRVLPPLVQLPVPGQCRAHTAALLWVRSASLARFGNDDDGLFCRLTASLLQRCCSSVSRPWLAACGAKATFCLTPRHRQSLSPFEGSFAQAVSAFAGRGAAGPAAVCGAPHEGLGFHQWGVGGFCAWSGIVAQFQVCSSGLGLSSNGSRIRNVVLAATSMLQFRMWFTTFPWTYPVCGAPQCQCRYTIMNEHQDMAGSVVGIGTYCTASAAVDSATSVTPPPGRTLLGGGAGTGSPNFSRSASCVQQQGV